MYKKRKLSRNSSNSFFDSPFSAIEILRDINQSSKRKGNFTETALMKLLESNLSAKYALTNSLGIYC